MKATLQLRSYGKSNFSYQPSRAQARKVSSPSGSQRLATGIWGAPDSQAPSTGLPAAVPEQSRYCGSRLPWLTRARGADIKRCTNLHAAEAPGDPIRGKNVILEQLLSLNPYLQMES